MKLAEFVQRASLPCQGYDFVCDIVVQIVANDERSVNVTLVRRHFGFKMASRAPDHFATYPTSHVERKTCIVQRASTLRAFTVLAEH